MTKHHSIVLDHADDYTIDGNQLTMRRGRATTHYRLPRARPVISVHEYESGRGQLNIGGFNSLAVTIVGPIQDIKTLRDGVL